MLNQKGSITVLVVIMITIIPSITFLTFNKTTTEYNVTNQNIQKTKAKYAAYSGLVFAGNYDQSKLENLTTSDKFYLDEENLTYFTIEYLSADDGYISTGHYKDTKFQYYFRN
jgi:hypothetical protein